MSFSPEFLNCLNQALRYLDIREHNTSELINKLKAKSYKVELIDEVVSYLKEENSLNEERYVNSFIRMRNRKRPESKKIMLLRLLSKGADKNTCIKVLDEVYTEEYTLSLIKTALSKLGEEKTKKLGFSYSEIKRVKESM